jgi:hypothetical protein
MPRWQQQGALWVLEPDSPARAPSDRTIAFIGGSFFEGKSNLIYCSVL